LEKSPVRRVEEIKPQSNYEFLDNQLITSTEQSPYREAYSRSTAQETGHALRDMTVHSLVIRPAFKSILS
jgi:hypothetical protein